MQIILSLFQRAASYAEYFFVRAPNRNSRFVLATLALSLTSSVAFAQTAFYYRNLPGNYPSAGLTRTFVAPAAAITATVDVDTILVTVQEDGPSNGSPEFWQIRFSAGQGKTLAVGTYEGAGNLQFPRTSSPALTVNGTQHGCFAQPTGRFIIQDIALSPNGSVSRLAANIYHDCGTSPNGKIVGEIRINSAIPLSESVLGTDTSPDPFALVMQSPVDPGTTVTSLTTMAYGINAPTPISILDGEYKINDGGFSAAPSTVLNADRITVRATAATSPGGVVTPTLTIGGVSASVPIKTYQAGMRLSGLRVVSPPGDPAGLGVQQLFLAPFDLVSFSQDFPNAITAQVIGRAGDVTTIGINDPLNSAFAVGAYENALRTSQGLSPTLAFSPRTFGGCNQAYGRFVIRELVRTASAIVSLAVDFEQSCELTKPPLRGEFRFNSVIPFSSLPIDIRYGVEIQKIGRGVGTVAGLGGELSCGVSCTTYLPLGWDLSLGASAALGSVFKRWDAQSPCFGSGVCRFTVTQAQIVVARFELPTKLTVKATGAGTGSISSSFGNINCASECSADFDLDTVVPLTALANFGSVFVGWSGGGCSGTGACSVVMSAAKTVEANFVLGYRLNVFSDQTYGAGRVTSVPAGIDCGLTCESVILPNTTVTLTATPGVGARFVGWSGAGCTGTGTCLLPMNQSTQVTAVFSSQPRTISVSKSGNGDGVVTSTNGLISCGNTCTANFTPQIGIQLIAIPVRGSVFKGWLGSPCANAGTDACFVFQNSDVAITANFDRVVVVPATPRPSDLNGDGTSDILVQASSGTTTAWLMNATTIASSAELIGASSGWTATHVADFNGDGKADVLWRHTDGRVAMWLMNGTTFVSGAGLLEANSGWSVTHVADFNGDGKADILYRHTDGRIAMWLMNGVTLTSGAGLLNAASGWIVTHTGDFNGDGKADILFSHADGRVAMWLMNGTTLTSGAGLLEAASGWSVTHVADFSGDGKADIVYRNTDGRIAMWLMNGTTLTSGAGLLNAASGWAVTHTADFNGDGKADIVYRHTDGRIAMWLMNGTTFTSGAGLLSANSGWSVTNTGDFNGDGNSDLLLRQSDGSIVMWLMNGTAVTTTAPLVNAGTLRVVP